MDRWATKDRFERETEETRRLVRPAPKIKPPRRDLRRERVEPEPDPDIDGDKDIAKDKDLHASTVARVASRFLGYDPVALGVANRFLKADLDRSSRDDDFVAVVNKETGEPTRVKKETLKGPEGKKYKVVEQEEEGETSEEDLKGGAAKLHEMAEGDPALASFIKKVKDPEQGFTEIAEANPKILLKQMFPKATFPPELKTLGDIAKALKLVPNAPPKGPKKAPPKKQKTPEVAAPAATKPSEAPKEEAPAAAEKPEAEGGGEPAEEAGPPSKPPPGKGPPTGGGPIPSGGNDDEEGPQFGGPSEEQKKQLADWLAKEGPTTPEFKAWAEKQKTISEKDGKFLFPVKGKGRLPFDELSIGDKLKVKAQFENDFRADKNLEGLKKLAQKPKLRKLMRALGNPSSDLRRKLDEQARADNRSLDESDVAKTIKELAGVELPEHVGSVQDLLDAAEKGFAPPGEPERSKPSKQEKQRTSQALSMTFPEDIASEVADMDLHPDDASDLISYYRAAMARPVDDTRGVKGLVAGLTGGGYHADPEGIDVPETDAEGKPFEDLSPEKQAEVYAKHKMHLIATSLAARERVKNALKSTGLPTRIAKTLSQAMLHAGDRVPSDDEVRGFYQDSLATAFMHEPLSREQISKLMKMTEGNPAASKFAVAYLQAKDYSDAREKFLEKDPEHPENQITEYDDPDVVARKLQKASRFLDERSWRYPPNTQSEDTAMEFRNRVIDRMAALRPSNVPIIRAYLEPYEAEDFDWKVKNYKRSVKEFNKASQAEAKAIQKERKSQKGGEPYRTPAEPDEAADNEEILSRLAKKGIYTPRKPTPPPGYEYVSSPAKVKERQTAFQKLWDKLFKGKKKASAGLTVEQRVALRFLYSSYSGLWTMGPSVRTALYWGQEPYEQTEAYPGPTQLQARDFNEADFNNILTAAREWLKVPVLGRPIKGMYPDTQFRAALDLALRDHENGKYSVGLYPTVYNELLAKLSSQPGPYELTTTLPTDVPTAGVKSAGKSTYGATTERGQAAMKVSQELRSFASRAAATTRDPELAFDLMELANRLASEEAQSAKQEQAGQEGQAEQQKQAAVKIAATVQNKFTSVRALVVQQAQKHPEARLAFLPILQAIR